MLSKLISRGSLHLLKTGTRSVSSFVQETSKIDDANSAMFTIGTENGFLPRKEPLIDLPPKYEVVDRILKAMTVE